MVAARELLHTRGVEAVTIREVARRAGVSHGAPRRHFLSRSQLLATLARDGFDELLRRLHDLDAADPPGRLAQAGQAYLELARERPALFELMTRHDLLAGSGLELRSSSSTALARWHDLVVAARPQARPQDSLLLFATVHGLASLHSRSATDVLGQDSEALLDELLHPAGGTPA